MAVRRLARQSLLWSEPPIASTSAPRALPCPACRNNSTSALPLNPTSRSLSSSSSDSTSSSVPRQAASSWNVISRASKALFAPTVTSTNARSPPEPVELSGLAAELVAELKLSKPDPHRAWKLFSQLDLQGLTHTLPLVSLRTLLHAIYLDPPSKASGRPLTVQASTSLAAAYSVKVDLIRLRIRQTGAPTEQRDLNALMLQYHALRYAPGIVKVWDEMVALGGSISPGNCERAFYAMAKWIEMHGRASGRAVERMAAQPLLRKALSMLSDLNGDGKRTTRILPWFFKIIIKAGDIKVFATAMKHLYGLDIRLPGAAAADVAKQGAKLRTLGEEEICWVLEALAESDDLSAMIAVFEVFDKPSLLPADGDFFTQSFSGASASTDDATPSPSPAADKPHLIGTRAFTILIQAASRLDSGSIARHYFDLLFSRWALDADRRIGDIERAVGSVEEPKEGEHVVVEGAFLSPEMLPSVSANQVELATGVDTAVDSSSDLSPSASFAAASSPTEATSSPSSPSPPTSTTSAPSPTPYSASVATLPVSHLVVPALPPFRPYAVPSTLIGDIAHYSLVHRDLPTARWVRIRTKRLLQLQEQQTRRIAAVLDRLEPAVAESDESAAGAQPPRSLVLLQRELALLTFHRAQTRLMLSSVKQSSNLVRASTELHRLQTTLSFRARRLADPALSKRELVRIRPGVRRKEQQVLLSRIVVLKHRLTRLKEMHGVGVGHWEYDKWMAEIKTLRKRADGQGIGEDVERELQEGQGVVAAA
ncbi:hypothetical protein JCM1841_001078 [Sporobolomyces salmonicolor]